MEQLRHGCRRPGPEPRPAPASGAGQPASAGHGGHDGPAALRPPVAGPGQEADVGDEDVVDQQVHSPGHAGAARRWRPPGWPPCRRPIPAKTRRRRWVAVRRTDGVGSRRLGRVTAVGGRADEAQSDAVELGQFRSVPDPAAAPWAAPARGPTARQQRIYRQESVPLVPRTRGRIQGQPSVDRERPHRLRINPIQQSSARSKRPGICRIGPGLPRLDGPLSRLRRPVDGRCRATAFRAAAGRLSIGRCP